MPEFNVESFVSSDVVSRHPAINDNTRQRILRYVKERVSNGAIYDRNNPLTIADIGCGNGKFTKGLVSKDIPKHCKVNYINKYLMDPYGNREIGIHLMNDIDFANKFASCSCDIIICKGVVHLFNNFQNFLINCQRILKPNGLMIIIHMSDEISFPWGKYAQKSFEASVKSDSFKWVVYDELQQHQFKLTSKVLIPKCKVQHERLKRELHLTKQQWYRFVEQRSWSTIQSLTNEQLNSCLDFVNTNYPNDTDIVNVDLKWIVSMIKKIVTTKITTTTSKKIYYKVSCENENENENHSTNQK